MSSLPDEVLLKIFSLLGARDLIKGVRVTCVRWAALSYDRSLWRFITSINAWSCNILSLINEAADILEDLTLENDSDLFPDFLSGKKCPNLRALHLREMDITEADFINLVSIYPLLEKLTILCCHSWPVTNNHLLHVTRQSRLRHLDIILKTGPDVTFKNEVFANMPHLVSLTLVGVNLSGNVIGLLNAAINLTTLVIKRSEINNCLREHLSNNTALETLILHHSYVSFIIDHEQLIHIAVHSPKLRSLSLDGNMDITERSVVTVTDVCTRLESLYVHTYGHPIISDAGLIKISYNCSNLRHLQIKNNTTIGDKGICHIAEYCPKIEYLVLSGCTITDKSIDAIALFSVGLRVLDVSNCRQITGGAISNLVVKCNLLTSLCLHGCVRIMHLNFDAFHEQLNTFGKKFAVEETADCARPSDQGFPYSVLESFVPSYQSVPDADLENARLSVQSVHLADLENVRLSNQSGHVAEPESVPVCSHLTLLDLSDTNTTGISLGQVALHCPDMLTLTIMPTFMVTNADIESILKGCRLLKELAISGDITTINRILSNSTFNAMACCSAKLVRLTINFNSRITIEDAEQVREKCKTQVLENNLESMSFTSDLTNLVTNNHVFDIAGSITDRCDECKSEPELDFESGMQRSYIVIFLGHKSQMI